MVVKSQGVENGGVFRERTRKGKETWPCRQSEAALSFPFTPGDTMPLRKAWSEHQACLDGWLC